MSSKHYILTRNSANNEVTYIGYDEKKGFKFKPKNNVNYNGVKVNELVVMKPNFIEKVLRKKIKRQLDLYLNYLAKLINNDDDDDDPTNLRNALNELTRYKRTIKNNYRVYLEQEYYNHMLKRIKILEQELKIKLMETSLNVKELEEEKTSRRSR